MSWSKVASELSNPAVIAIAITAAGALIFGITRKIKSRQDRRDYSEADEIMKNAPKVRRIHIPGYSSRGPH